MHAKHDLIERYRLLNEGFGSPFIFKLTGRGFFSEVNCLLNAALYGLLFQRRLIVDQSDFGGLSWVDFFVQDLPSASDRVRRSVDLNWVINGTEHQHFVTISRYVLRRHLWRVPVAIWPLRICGSVFDAKRTLAALLCRPLETASRPRSLPSHYAAFHIRRGDKTEGYLGGSVLLKEGEETAPSAYLSLLQKKAPDVRSVFVMTDDYRMVEELRATAPELRFETLCAPSERGYRQSDFDNRSIEDKAAKIRRLITETQIAAASSVFIGGFMSNVARFITLRHHRPGSCFSVDSRRKWLPD